MGRHTGIQWADSTVNPVMGCDGCELWSRDPRGRRTCYAGLQHEKRRGAGWARHFLEPEMFAGRVADAMKFGDLRGKARPDKPWLDGYPRLIFVSDMGDALSRRIPFDFLWHEIFDPAARPAGQRHVLMWLTKRASRMAEFDRWVAEWHPDEQLWWPRNVWAMTTVTGPGTEARVDSLRRVGHEGTTRLISFEPLLGEPEWDRCLAPRAGEGAIHGAIFGGESGDAGIVTAMDVEIIRRGIAACRRHGVAPFVKQLGRLPIAEVRIDGRLVRSQVELQDSHGGDWVEWINTLEDLRVRELPRPSWLCLRAVRAAHSSPASSPIMISDSREEPHGEVRSAEGIHHSGRSHGAAAEGVAAAVACVPPVHSDAVREEAHGQDDRAGAVRPGGQLPDAGRDVGEAPAGHEASRDRLHLRPETTGLTEPTGLTLFGHVAPSYAEGGR